MLALTFVSGQIVRPGDKVTLMYSDKPRSGVVDSIHSSGIDARLLVKTDIGFRSFNTAKIRDFAKVG